MNDRYLYRAKRTDNGEWVEGFYLPIGERTYIICEAESDCTDGENTDLYATEWYEVASETVCQYSSISDKNDESVFENHIVRDDDGRVGIIKFGRNDLHVGFYLEWVSEKAMYYRKELGFWASKAEVIGNIFDNPDLLEASYG